MQAGPLCKAGHGAFYVYCHTFCAVRFTATIYVGLDESRRFDPHSHLSDSLRSCSSAFALTR
jgi:hypothetical protein